MIFPDMPKKRNFWTQPQIDQVNQAAEIMLAKMHPAPIADPEPPQHKTIEEWWVEHGLSPASVPGSSHSGPVDWFARDAWEFYFLCVGIVAWVAYWYQYSH